MNLITTDMLNMCRSSMALRFTHTTKKLFHHITDIVRCGCFFVSCLFVHHHFRSISLIKMIKHPSKQRTKKKEEEKTVWKAEQFVFVHIELTTPHITKRASSFKQPNRNISSKKFYEVEGITKEKKTYQNNNSNNYINGNSYKVCAKGRNHRISCCRSLTCCAL